MLVETRDTITVPAQIMIRILASLHQYRRLMNAAGSESRSRAAAAEAADSNSIVSDDAAQNATSSDNNENDHENENMNNETRNIPENDKI